VQDAPGMKLSEVGAADKALRGIRSFVDAHRMKHRGGGSGFAEFERGLHAEVMKVERELVAEELARADLDADVVLVDGVEHRRVLRAEHAYMTAAGEVRVMRTLHKDRSDPAAQSICAMEMRAGIVAGFWSPLAAEQSLWIVSQMTPQLGEDLLRRLGNMQPSKASLDRLPKQIAERWEDDREVFEATLRETTTVSLDVDTLAISLDGVYAPMKDTDPVAKRAATAAAGKIAKGPAGYKEVGCAAISLCDHRGEMMSAIRFARMPETKKTTLKGMITAEVAHLRDARPGLTLVTLADGMEDNWEYLDAEYPTAVAIIDFFHATEHLNAALADIYGDGTVEARRRFADLRHVLLEVDNGVENVIRALDYLKRKHSKSGRVRQVLAYFRRHRHKMQYAAFRARGLPIGSGVVEAACKTLVAQRMKNSGMRWSHLGGQAILNPRGWVQSERFDEAWALVAATYRVDVTLLSNVVPIRPRAA
jgi:hypothetical protein